jgi:hypothetical protein
LTLSRLKNWLLEELEADRRTFAIAYVALLPLYLAPLFVARYLPGLDLPFHLSMADMLGKEGRADSAYAALYQGTLGFHPYSLHYWALRLLGLVLPLMVAQKVLVAAYVAGLPLGAAALLGACGRSRIPALLAFPLAYNLTLHYGFVAFALSLPLLLLVLATFARLLSSPEASWANLVTAGAGALALFLCHLQNFLFGSCAVLAFVALSGAAWKRRLQALAALVPGAAALLGWQLSARFANHPGEDRGSLAYAWNALKVERLSDLEGHTFLQDALGRLAMIHQHLLKGFYDGSDARAARAVLLVVLAYFALGLWGQGEGRPSWQSKPRLVVAGWVVFLGAVLAYLGLPHHLRALELMTFYPRFSVLLVLMALLAIPGSLRNLGGAVRPLLLLPALVVGGLYGQDLLRLYRLYDREVQDFSAVVERTPPGGKALGLVFDRSSRVLSVESALMGMPSLYPVLRPSAGSMTSLLYCGMRHMPCRRKEPPVAIPELDPWTPEQWAPEKAIDFFDYFFVRLPPPGSPIFAGATPRVELLAQSGSWLVYRRKPAPVAGAVPPDARAP